jgi:hypothetical protein
MSDKKKDVMGVRHEGGEDSYGGTVGPGQSAGGAYPNPHTGGGGSATGPSGRGEHEAGGQTHVGYYGGGQLGGRHVTDQTNYAGAESASPDSGNRTYQDSPIANGADGSTPLSRAVDKAGFGEHAPLGGPGPVKPGGDADGPDDTPGSG